MIRESRTGWGGLGSSNDEIPQRIIILSSATRVLAATATEAELSFFLLPPQTGAKASTDSTAMWEKKQCGSFNKACRRSKEVCMLLNQKGMKTIYNHPFWMILYTLFQIIHICMSIVSLFRLTMIYNHLCLEGSCNQFLNEFTPTHVIHF